MTTTEAASPILGSGLTFDPTTTKTLVSRDPAPSRPVSSVLLSSLPIYIPRTTWPAVWNVVMCCSRVCASNGCVRRSYKSQVKYTRRAETAPALGNNYPSTPTTAACSQ